MRILALAIGIASVILTAPVLAADSPPAPPKLIKGTIVSLAGDVLAVKADDNRIVSVGMLPNTNIVFDEMRKLSDIKQGDFIGSAAAKGADGKLHAKEVHIFPASLRGAGEGQYPWGETGSKSSMTNATVTATSHMTARTTGSMTNATVTKAAGGTLALSFHGAAATNGVCGGPAAMAAPNAGCTGFDEILVSATTPIVALVPGDRTLLLPGKAVSMFVVTDKAGKSVALGMTVEKSGIKPIN